MSPPNMSVVAAVQPSPPTSTSPIDDPVPTEVLAVIELFSSQLAKVSFPEIDAGSLRRQADELRAEAKLVAKAREALDAMLAVLAGKLAALTDTSSRAIAYARIYSDAHPDRTALAAALVALTDRPAPLAPLTANGKRRGRPPKRSAELFDVAPTEPAGDDA